MSMKARDEGEAREGATREGATREGATEKGATEGNEDEDGDEDEDEDEDGRMGPESGGERQVTLTRWPLDGQGRSERE
jgi:hypothetical protein